MLKSLTVGALALTVLVAPVAAQEAASDPGLERRQDLAERFIALSLGDNLEKTFDAMVEQILSAQGAEGAEGEWMRRNLPTMVTDMVEDIAERSAPLYAARMTEEELTALVDFYDTPMGREIARKNMELAVEMQPMIDAAALAYVEELMTKFCAEFDCSAPAPGATPSKL